MIALYLLFPLIKAFIQEIQTVHHSLVSLIQPCYPHLLHYHRQLRIPQLHLLMPSLRLAYFQRNLLLHSFHRLLRQFLTTITFFLLRLTIILFLVPMHPRHLLLQHRLDQLLLLQFQTRSKERRLLKEVSLEPI